METKYTKEYAEKLANELYPSKTTAGYNDHWSLSDRKAFIIGYMKAIEETAAPGLLEALIRIKILYMGSPINEYLEPYKEAWQEVDNAINKATLWNIL